MTPTLVPPSAELATQENFGKFKEQMNKREAEVQHGTPAKPAEVAPVVEEKKPESHLSPAEKSLRRQARDARREADELRGRLKAIEEFGLTKKAEELKPVEAKPDDPEPKREGYASEAEYHRALGRWEGRQGAKETLAKRDQTEAEKQATEAFHGVLKAASDRAFADLKEIPDAYEVATLAEAMAKEGKRVTVDFGNHPSLTIMLAKSDVQAFILDYFSRRDEGDAELRELVAMKDGSEAMIAAFHQLEGWIKRSYRSQVTKKADDKPKPETAEEKAAKLSRPTAASVKGGKPANSGEVSPTLEDGVTINPEWKREMNRREMARRN